MRKSSNSLEERRFPGTAPQCTFCQKDPDTKGIQATLQIISLITTEKKTETYLHGLFLESVYSLTLPEQCQIRPRNDTRISARLCCLVKSF